MPLVAVCGNYNCAPGAASFCYAKGARGAMQAIRGGDMQAQVDVCGIHDCARGAASLLLCHRGARCYASKPRGDIDVEG